MIKMILFCCVAVLSGCCSTPPTSQNTAPQGAIKVIEGVDNVVDCISEPGRFWGLADEHRELRTIHPNEFVCFEFEAEKF